MLILQHILHDLLSKNTQIEKINDDYLGYLILPDSIRYLTKKRKYSHFERARNEKWNFYSSIKFPEKLTKEEINKSLSTIYDADDFLRIDDHSNCSVGEETSVETFFETNKYLSNDHKQAILTHLLQDIMFDIFVRDIIDCSQRFDDKFKIKISKNDCQQYNGSEIRKTILDIEEWGIYYLLNRMNLYDNVDYLNNIINSKISNAYKDIPNILDNTKKFIDFNNIDLKRFENKNFKFYNCENCTDEIKNLYKATLGVLL